MAPVNTAVEACGRVAPRTFEDRDVMDGKESSPLHALYLAHTREPVLKTAVRMSVELWRKRGTAKREKQETQKAKKCATENRVTRTLRESALCTI